MNPPLHIVLVEPEIPPNTGNIARLCAGLLYTGFGIHASPSFIQRKASFPLHFRCYPPSGILPLCAGA